MRMRSISPFDVHLQAINLPQLDDGIKRPVVSVVLYVKDGTGKSTPLLLASVGTSDESIDKEIVKLKHDLDVLGLKAKRLVRKAGTGQ